MITVIAKNAGFCSGVNKAVNILLEKASEIGEGSVLGELVHNDLVVDYLEARSINKVEKPEDAGGKFLAIRTHGVPPQVLAALKEKDEQVIIDLTCPRVKRVQEIASELAEKNFKIIINRLYHNI